MPIRYSVVTVSALVALSGTAHAQSPVEVRPVETRGIEQRVNVSGTVTSPRTAVLSTAVSGLVVDIVADVGDRVEAGTELLRLDDELAALAFERSRAEQQQAETGLADARRRLADAIEVGERRAIAQTEIESLRAEVESDGAALTASRVAAREQEALLERHTLKAPFAGVISERNTDLGEWVTPGTGLYELVGTDDLNFDFRVAQDYFRALTSETPVEIALDALPDTMIDGRIAAIVPVKNPGARTFLVRVAARLDEDAMMYPVTPGMSVRGTLRLATGRIGTVVSRDAIIRFPDGRVTVWVIDDSGELPIVREQIVQTGLEFGGLVEILSGLGDSDVVVVRGNETLQDGQTVSILNEAS